MTTKCLATLTYPLIKMQFCDLLGNATLHVLNGEAACAGMSRLDDGE